MRALQEVFGEIMTHQVQPADPPGINVRRLLMLAESIPANATHEIEKCPCGFQVQPWARTAPLGVHQFEAEGLRIVNMGGPYELRYGNYLNFQACRVFFGLTDDQARRLFVDHDVNDGHCRVLAEAMREEIMSLVAEAMPGFGRLLAAGRVAGLSAVEVLFGYRALVAMGAAGLERGKDEVKGALEA